MKLFVILLFFGCLAFFVLQSFSFDSYYFLRQARDFGGVGGYDWLRVFPVGNLDSPIFLSGVLFWLHYLTGWSFDFSAQFLTWLFIVCFELLVLNACKLVSGDKKVSFLFTTLLFVNPFFNSFLYFTPRLIELLAFLVTINVLLWTLRNRSIKGFFWVLLSCGVFLWLRPIKHSLSRLKVLSNFGVAELSTMGMVPFRAYFFILPLITIFFCWFYTHTVKRKGFWQLFLVYLIVLSVIGNFFKQDSVLNDSGLETTVIFVNTHKPLVIIDDWNLGYYWQYKTNTPTLWDGGSFIIPEKSLIYSLYLSPPNETITILRQLTKGQNGTIYILAREEQQQTTYLYERFSNKKYTSESLLYKMLTKQTINNITLIFNTTKNQIYNTTPP